MISTTHRAIIGLWLLTVGHVPAFASQNNRNAMNDKKINCESSAKPTQLMDNGQLVSEQTDNFELLSFLYTNNLGRCVRLLLNHRSINNIYAMYQDSCLSKHKIAPFVNKHHINLDDFEQPVGGYQSFNDFFIRKIKPGRRPIDQNPRTLVAPADSKLLVIPTITPTTTFFVKTLPFNLETFLHNHKLATDYTNGTMLIFRLAPYDYHRFHFPTDGIPDAPIVIKGRFDSVNPLVYKAGYQPLLSNERHIIPLHTKEFDTVLMIPVGAMLVGKIVETYTPQQPVNKGDEAGYFAFGGSTVVLLFKPGIIKPKEQFLQNSNNGFETVVKMGETINLI